MERLAVVLVKVLGPKMPAPSGRQVGSRPVAQHRRLRALVTALLVVLPAMTAVAPASAAASSPGQLYAFGENDDGQLGNPANNGNATAPNPTPALLSIAAANGPVVQVATAKDHTLVVTSTGQVFSFGDNYYGQLGSTTNANNSAVTANPSPMPVTLPGPAVQVAAGDQFSLALTSSGQMYAFGTNEEGQLGNANNDASIANPTPTLVTLPGESGTVTQIAAGNDFSLALTSGGQVYAFGDNQYGQLGNATNNSTTAANATPTQVGLPAGRVVQIAAGYDFSLALSSTGQIFAFGDNDYGQLGNPSNVGTTTANPSATQVSLPGETGTVVQIAAGGYHSLALTSTGQVFAFGDNDFGELANPANNGSTSGNPTPALVKLPGAPGPAAHVAAGFDDSLVLTASGQLFGFGNNEYGQLGNSANSGTSGPNPAPLLVSLPSGTTADTVFGGSSSYSTFAVVADLAIMLGPVSVGRVHSAYAAQVRATGGATPYDWTAVGLPPGLSIGAANGKISGKPKAKGTFVATVTVTDRFGIKMSVHLKLTIKAAAAHKR
ncbi:MAG: putative Ig domain-containing protein [Acidimicrobiales bacterium]